MRRVPGRMQYLQAGRPGLEGIALPQGPERKGYRRALVHADFRACGGLQLLIAADVIGMKMGVDDVGDAHAFVPGDIQIVLNIALGVHHDHGSGLGTADAVRETSKPRSHNLLEIHASSVW